jgi:hypothetical protein
VNLDTTRRLLDQAFYCRERKPDLDAICDRVCDYINRLPV